MGVGSLFFLLSFLVSAIFFLYSITRLTFFNFVTNIYRYMAKLYINKDIVADQDKMENWYLTGDEGMSFTDVQSFISWIDPNDNHIDIELHSCGGDTSEGYAIYDAIRATGKEISSTAVGRCASMATIIHLAAPVERRKAYPHAKFLIHSPYLPQYDGEIDLETIESIKSGLEVERERMLALYVERTGVERSLLEEQMNKGSWFGGEAAKQLGFISEVLMPLSAKINNQKSKKMSKERRTTVNQSLLDRLLAKAGYAKIEDVPSVALELTTAGGDVLTVEREEGDPQVGDAASPDGEHVMPDGQTIVVSDGTITEIKEAEEEDTEDVEALKARIDALEAENATLKSSAKSEREVRMLAAVTKAGGEDWLRKVTGSYVPSKRTGSPQGKKLDDEKPLSKIDKKLAEAREKNKNRYK